MLLKEIKGVGVKTLDKLNSLGIYTTMDLVDYLPKHYLDFTKVSKPDDIVEGEYTLLKVSIVHVYPKQYSKNKVCYIKADCICENMDLNLIWFNMPFMEYSLSCGDFLVWGVIKYENKKYTMVNPNISDINNKYKLKDIKPTYSLKGKISEVSYRKIVENALDNCVVENLLPNHFDLAKIYKNIHFAKSYSDMLNSQKELATYELAVQLLCYKVLRKTFKCDTLLCKFPHIVDNLLPYKLTESQINALNAIINDLKSGSVMNRFVLGDVGSGKTIVAHLAMYMVFEKGYQSALLAPTEILAMQHYNNFNKVFEGLNIKTAILTSSTSKENREIILQGLRNGAISILFSTHSCVRESVVFNNLKLAVIDEAHKFGVKQKADLIAKGESVHCLSMSATPLPRSFAMMVFGDLTISKLYKAENRKSNIKTYTLRSNKIDDMFKYFGDKIKNNSQIIIVCPRVVDSELEDIYSVKSVYKMLCEKYFDNHRWGYFMVQLKMLKKIE